MAQDKKPSDTSLNSGNALILVSPTTAVSNITLHNLDGKQAIIDFSGDKVKYSGDLPVDESAKIFFDAVMHYDQARCDERAKKLPAMGQSSENKGEQQ